MQLRTPGVKHGYYSPGGPESPCLAAVLCRYRIRNSALNTYMLLMNKLSSPEKAARQERQRLAAEDGSKALQEVTERATAVRENMVRLRALRLAKEAEAARAETATANEPSRAKPKRSKVGVS